ncbi:hypothetical protein ABXT06_09860 [Flavobacterium sp. UW10123]|uniref:hypothetical protein n=1 Tax=Flavobacterium sp. UW10123 TaxID=3230800 RepID=UPI00339A0CAF
MIKIYVDWNIMSGMRSNHFPELLSILLNNDKFLCLYSTSHISDIFRSYSDDEEQKARIQDDLEFITKITNDFCLFNDGKNIILDQYDPQELLDSRIEESDIFSDLSIDNLFKSDSDDPALNSLLEYFKTTLKSLELDSVFKEAFENPESAKILNDIFPGLKDDLTMNGFFNSFSKMNYNLNETEGYKDLRQIVQKIGVNSGHFNENKDPFELIDNSYKKKGIENFKSNEYLPKGKNAPEWYDEIMNEYLYLDMHGYKSDKVKVSEKERNTFSNTTDDASHTAFASICSFYLTNDDKNYLKTKAVYKKLSIETKVLKPAEFIEYYNEYLNYNSISDHFKSLFEIFTKPIFYDTDNDEGEYFGKFAYPNEYFFNFFNKIWVPVNKGEDYFYFTLSTIPPNPSKIYTAFKEIESLVRMFYEAFGPDKNGLELFEISEIQNEIWGGRHWLSDVGEIKLVRINGWLQLYYNNEEIKKKIVDVKLASNDSLIKRLLKGYKRYFKSKSV